MNGSQTAEIPFSDGNITGAVRVGDTVRRSVGTWATATHPLLNYLEQAGFAGAPRTLGFDEHRREVLTYVPGETDPNPLVSFAADDALAAVATLLREYHDATIAFKSSADAPWQYQVGAPRTGNVICHNDIAPWNTVVSDGRVVAFIDWDFAAPAPRIWDIAHAIWRFVPLHDDPQFGPLSEQARRIRLFCHTYGIECGPELLRTIIRRQRVHYDSIMAWSAAQVPAYVAMVRDGHAEMALADIRFLLQNQQELATMLPRR